MRTKKVKPPIKKFEYTLRISLVFDETKRKEYLSFEFATTKPFLTYQYLLKVEAEVIDNKIKFTIAGFTAPAGELGTPGYANSEFRYYDFKSTEYKIDVHRKNLDVSRFKLNVNKKVKEKLKLSGLSRTSFIEIKLEE